MSTALPRRAGGVHVEVPRSVRPLIGSTLAAYLVLRVLGVAVITWIAQHQDPTGIPGRHAGETPSYWDLTDMWDGRWYQSIAEHGYPSHVPTDDEGLANQSELAFYPLYPMLVRALMGVTGGSFTVLSGLVSLVLGLGAVMLMAGYLSHHLGQKAAFCTTLVVMSAPPALTFQMGYTESLAMLLLVAVLWALETRRWEWAAVLCVLLGYARPIGLPLAVVVAAVLIRRCSKHSVEPVQARERAGMVGVALAGLGSGLLWPLTAWWLTGRRDAYSATMSAWRDHRTIVPFDGWFSMAKVFVPSPWSVLGVLALMAVTALLVLGPWSARLGLVMRVWCGAYALYLFATSVPWSSTLRYLLELFPLAAALIGAACRGRRRLVVPLTCGFVLLNLVATCWWAWNFLRFVPPAGNPI